MNLDTCQEERSFYVSACALLIGKRAVIAGRACTLFVLLSRSPILGKRLVCVLVVRMKKKTRLGWST